MKKIVILIISVLLFLVLIWIAIKGIDIPSDKNKTNIKAEDSSFLKEELKERFVKFRTYKLDYSTGNAVAYSLSCDGSNLRQYSRTHETCYEHKCDEEPEFYIPAENGDIKFWSFNLSHVCICDLQDFYDIENGYSRVYADYDRDAIKVSQSGTSIDPRFEVSC